MGLTPPASDAEIHAASVLFVRKLSGFTKPSQANEAVFDRAVDDVAGVARQLIDSLVTAAPARDRDEVAARARTRGTEVWLKLGRCRGFESPVTSTRV